jgi:hypothetical protein
VPADLLGHLLGDAAADEIADGGAAQVVEQQVRDAGGLGGRRPGADERAAADAEQAPPALCPA